MEMGGGWRPAARPASAVCCMWRHWWKLVILEMRLIFILGRPLKNDHKWVNKAIILRRIYF